MKEYLLCALLSYFIGSIQPSYLLGEMVKKIDIREYGSGNAGASNVTVVLGWKFGILTAVLDIFKGIGAVQLCRYCISDNVNVLYAAYFFVVFGHMFPYYMGFKGGKGLAASLGAFGMLFFVQTWIIGGVLIAITLATGYIALGTAAVALLTLAYTIYVYGLSTPAYIAAAITAIMLCKHFINFKRIIKGEEISLWSTFKKKTDEGSVDK